MRDEHHARPLLHDAPDEREQFLNVAFGQKRCWLVEHEQPPGRPAPVARSHLLDRPDDRQLRALHGGELRDGGGRVDVQPVLCEDRGCPSAFLLPRDPPAQSRGQLADEEILDDRQRGDKTEVLMHEADPVPSELARLQGQLDLVVVDQQPAARVGRVVASENLDQRRLARTILAEQAVDLAPHDLQAGSGQCPLPTEGFREVFDDQGVWHYLSLHNFR